MSAGFPSLLSFMLECPEAGHSQFRMKKTGLLWPQCLQCQEHFVLQKGVQGEPLLNLNKEEKHRCGYREPPG